MYSFFNFSCRNGLKIRTYLNFLAEKYFGACTYLYFFALKYFGARTYLCFFGFLRSKPIETPSSTKNLRKNMQGRMPCNLYFFYIK